MRSLGEFIRDYFDGKPLPRRFHAMGAAMAPLGFIFVNPDVLQALVNPPAPEVFELSQKDTGEVRNQNDICSHESITCKVNKKKGVFIFTVAEGHTIDHDSLSDRLFWYHLGAPYPGLYRDALFQSRGGDNTYELPIVEYSGVQLIRFEAPKDENDPGEYVSVDTFIKLLDDSEKGLVDTLQWDIIWQELSDELSIYSPDERAQMKAVIIGSVMKGNTLVTITGNDGTEQSFQIPMITDVDEYQAEQNQETEGNIREFINRYGISAVLAVLGAAGAILFSRLFPDRQHSNGRVYRDAKPSTVSTEDTVRKMMQRLQEERAAQVRELREGNNDRDRRETEANALLENEIAKLQQKADVFAQLDDIVRQIVPSLDGLVGLLNIKAPHTPNYVDLELGYMNQLRARVGKSSLPEELKDDVLNYGDTLIRKLVWSAKEFKDEHPQR